MAETPGRPPERQSQKGPGEYLGYGLTWVLSTLLFMLGGQALDQWLGTGQVLTLVGAFVGAAAGFWSMYFHLVIEPKRRDEERKGRGE